MSYRLIAFLLLAAAVLHSQITTGALSGYVLGPDHKAIAGASIVISDANRLHRRASADDSGFYRVAGLAPAVYSVTASAQGFDAGTVRGVVIGVDTHSRLNVELTVAHQTASVDVAATVLPAENSELASALDRKAIESLPLNRRDFLQLALLSPGVQIPVQDSELSTRGRFSMHVRGAREEFNNFLLDGVDNNDQYENTYTLQPSMDAIQEFRIVTGTYNAEYGRSAGGQVNVITRSGGNDWHGEAYWYLRNRALDARNFFDAGSKPQFQRNQSGAGLGGPIRRDRTFFYVNYDGLREAPRAHTPGHRAHRRAAILGACVEGIAGGASNPESFSHAESSGRGWELSGAAGPARDYLAAEHAGGPSPERSGFFHLPL
jgi:Outer membrane receptor for ferrienterochelin and colicins